jgi:hypothetical protein
MKRTINNSFARVKIEIFDGINFEVNILEFFFSKIIVIVTKKSMLLLVLQQELYKQTFRIRSIIR